MADYYNATRGPLALTLTDGTSTCFPPKSWIFIPADKENSASIVNMLAKGFLVRSKVPITVPPAPAESAPKVEAVVPPPAPKPAPVPAETLPLGIKESFSKDDSPKKYKR